MVATIFYEDHYVASLNDCTELVNKLKNAKEIWVQFDHKSQQEIENLLREIYSIQKFYVLKPFKITIEHNDCVNGKKLSKIADSLEKKIAISWLTRTIVVLHNKIENELSTICERLSEIIEHAK